MAYIQGYSTYGGCDMLNRHEIRDMREAYKEFMNLKEDEPIKGLKL